MITKTKRDDAHLFDAYLSEGESILWMGQPNPNWLLSPSDVILIPFSLMWGGFAIFWETGALGAAGPSFFALWGIPFVIVGQYFIWGRFVHKYLRRRQTYYAITERRALVLNKLFGSNLKAYFLHQFASLNRQGKSVLFDFNNSSMNLKRNWQDWSGESQPGFYALADAEEVSQLIQDLIVPPKSKNDWN
jgi:hypothetical protein